MDSSTSSKEGKYKPHASNNENPFRDSDGLCLRSWARTHPTTVSRIPKHFEAIDQDTIYGKRNKKESSRGHKTTDKSLVNSVTRLRSRLFPRQVRPIEYHHYPTSGPARFVRITDGAEKDETIRQIENAASWPDHFKWRLISYHVTADNEPVAVACICLKDFPQQLQNGITWADGDQQVSYQKLVRWGTSYWEGKTYWHDHGPGRLWRAAITLRHQDADHLLAADGRKLIQPETIQMLSLHQRLGPDTYKEVVRFDAFNAYGNDLNGQKLTDWNHAQGIPKELLKFIDSLYPHKLSFGMRSAAFSNSIDIMPDGSKHIEHQQDSGQWPECKTC